MKAIGTLTAVRIGDPRPLFPIFILLTVQRAKIADAARIGALRSYLRLV